MPLRPARPRARLPQSPPSASTTPATASGSPGPTPPASSGAPAPTATKRSSSRPTISVVFLARWSPDGKHLALMARDPGKAWQIYLVGAEGDNLHPLLRESRNAADPSWSPDGKSLVFGRVNDYMGKENASAHPPHPPSRHPSDRRSPRLRQPLQPALVTRRPLDRRPHSRPAPGPPLRRRLPHLDHASRALRRRSRLVL